MCSPGDHRGRDGVRSLRVAVLLAPGCSSGDLHRVACLRGGVPRGVRVAVPGWRRMRIACRARPRYLFLPQQGNERHRERRSLEWLPSEMNDAARGLQQQPGVGDVHLLYHANVNVTRCQCNQKQSRFLSAPPIALHRLIH